MLSVSSIGASHWHLVCKAAVMVGYAAPTRLVTRTLIMGCVALSGDMVWPAAIGAHVLLVEVLLCQRMVFHIVTVPGNGAGLSASQPECLISTAIITAQSTTVSPRQLSQFVLLTHKMGHPLLCIGGDQTTTYSHLSDSKGLGGTYKTSPPLAGEVLECLHFCLKAVRQQCSAVSPL